MTTVDFATAQRRLRAPRQSQQRLIDPEPWMAAQLLQANRGFRETCDIRIGDVTLHDLSAAARTELVELAWQHTTQYRDATLPLDLANAAVILSGHQPELFHPGVWFKSFLLDRLAARQRAVGIQLIIDNDLLQQPTIRVPSGTPDAPSTHFIAFDAHAPALPYEQRPLYERQPFQRFADEVAGTVRPLIADPLVTSLWSHMRRAADTAPKPLGQILAEGRHRYEQDLGLNTLEVPWSAVCDTRSFHRFAVHLLRDLPTLHALYNQTVLEYRQRRRLRSQSHPVPLLGRDGDWWESPLWVWSDELPQRQPLWVRRLPQYIELRGAAADDQAAAVPIQRLQLQGADTEDLVDQLQQLRQRGIKIRTRALITTMYARTVLSDLFVHGIGGSVYDQITNVFIARFLKLQPPAFLTVSATFMLPVSRPNVDDDDLRQVQGLLRDLWYHPEQHLEWASTETVPWATIGQWVEQKRQWIERDGTQAQARERHLALEEINAKLRGTLESAREQLLAEQHELRRQLRVREQLGSREYSFCLFPQEMLVPALRRLVDDV